MHYVDQLHLETIVIYYEDLLVHPQRTFDRILAFLGLEPAKMQFSIAKNTDDDLRKAIVNFDELRSEFAGSSYEPMFDEVLASGPLL